MSLPSHFILDNEKVPDGTLNILPENLLSRVIKFNGHFSWFSHYCRWQRCQHFAVCKIWAFPPPFQYQFPSFDSSLAASWGPLHTSLMIFSGRTSGCHPLSGSNTSVTDSRLISGIQFCSTYHWYIKSTSKYSDFMPILNFSNKLVIWVGLCQVSLSLLCPLFAGVRLIQGLGINFQGDLFMLGAWWHKQAAVGSCRVQFLSRLVTQWAAWASW